MTYRPNTARIAAAAVLCLLAAACGRNDTTTADAGRTGSTTGTSTTAGNPDTGMPKGTASQGPTSTTAGSTTAGGNLDTMPPTAAGPMTLSSDDKKFLTDAAAGGMYEVQVSQMAATKATDPKIKAFGEKLAQDHSKANDELKAFASSHSVTLPAELPADKKKDVEKLSKASGADFDKQYVKTVGLHDHEKDIAMFEKAGKNTKNTELKAWIDKTLPTLKDHHAQAKQLPGAS